jgi:hypothetical protein
MTGPEHFRKAEQLAAKAGEYLGRGDGQDTAAVWAAVAQVHATLALAAATATGASGADSHAWAETTGTESPAGVPIGPGVRPAPRCSPPS